MKKPKRKKRPTPLCIQCGALPGTAEIVIEGEGGKRTRGHVCDSCLSEIKKPTKLIHESLTTEQDVFSRYTYKWCGRLLYGNYEQWEAGFLRERDPDAELRFWLQASETLRFNGIDDDNRAKSIIGELAKGVLSPKTQKLIDKAKAGVDWDERFDAIFKEVGVDITDDDDQ